jgi:hypothetical protein
MKSKKQPFTWVERIKGSGEHFRFNGKEYLLHLSMQDAYHLMVNYMGRDENHRITPLEIGALLLQSAIVPHATNQELHYCFGRHRNEVYMAVVYLKKNGLCAVHTCFRVNDIYKRKPYEDFEYHHPRGSARTDGGEAASR